MKSRDGKDWSRFMRILVRSGIGLSFALLGYLTTPYHDMNPWYFVGAAFILGWSVTKWALRITWYLICGIVAAVVSGL